MKNSLTVLFLLLLVQTSSAQNFKALEKRAGDHFQLLVSKDYETLVADFDDPMLAQIDRSRLEQIWLGIASQLGGFEEVLVLNASQKGNYVRVTITSAFKKGYLKSYFTYNSREKISGIFFTPEVVERTYNAPAYVDKEKFAELNYQIEKDGVKLPAILSLPKSGDNLPLIILVHGSGPLDKDLSIEKLKPFRDLAWGLASRGIAVLRYDKRTFVYGTSTEEVSGGKITPQNETIDDVIAALELARAFEKVNPSEIYVFGHSLGAMLASGMEEGAQGLVKGYILAGGSPRPLEKILYEQYQYVLGLDGLNNDEKKQLKDLKLKTKRVRKGKYNISTPSSDLPLGVGPEYWQWLSTFDPVSALKESKARILLLHAERDYQIVEKDLKAWQKAFGDKAETRSYEKLFHPFIETDSSPLAKPSDYNVPGHIPEYVILDIWRWVMKGK